MRPSRARTDGSWKHRLASVTSKDPISNPDASVCSTDNGQPIAEYCLRTFLEPFGRSDADAPLAIRRDDYLFILTNATRSSTRSSTMSSDGLQLLGLIPNLTAFSTDASSTSSSRTSPRRSSAASGRRRRRTPGDPLHAQLDAHLLHRPGIRRSPEAYSCVSITTEEQTFSPRSNALVAWNAARQVVLPHIMSASGRDSPPFRSRRAAMNASMSPIDRGRLEQSSDHAEPGLEIALM